MAYKKISLRSRDLRNFRTFANHIVTGQTIKVRVNIKSIVHTTHASTLYETKIIKSNNRLKSYSSLNNKNLP